MEHYEPKIIEDNRTPDGKRGHVLMTFALEIKPCSICGRLIFNAPIDTSLYNRRQFPSYLKINAAAQVKAAGLVPAGYNPGDNYDAVCKICESEGRVEFTCFCCGEKRKSSLFHDVEYSEPFCKVCYESKSAKEWNEAVERASELHKYDYD